MSAQACQRNTLSEEQVRLAYLTILKRPPENNKVIEEHLSRGCSFLELCCSMMASQEFASKEENLRTEWSKVEFLEISDLDMAAAAFLAGKHDLFAKKILRLPDWFNKSMDPDCLAYGEQILRLWSSITGRNEYHPASDEDTAEVGDQDFFARPAFYQTADARVAGGHLMAIGHIVTRSELPANGRVLEYGSGFGQTALTFARLGATVHTVDVNEAFCEGVQRAGDHYNVDLRSFCNEFGYNPSGIDHSYDLVLFYESFHHCNRPDELIARLAKIIKPTGCVILAGEPIFTRSDAPEMPYPWGFRLDWENVAIMRVRGWMELGYREDYLSNLFARHGFTCEFFPDENSHWAQVYRFRLAG